jgi:hypothetical protein
MARNARDRNLPWTGIAIITIPGAIGASYMAVDALIPVDAQVPNWWTWALATPFAVAIIAACHAVLEHRRTV